MSFERTVGRRPDPEIEPRVYSAALEVYSEVGWGAFTLDAVSRRAKVGKAAIYGRWGDKVTLLSASFLSKQVEPEDIDTGSLRGDLLGVARIELQMWTSEFGQALRRAEVDAVSHPDIFSPLRDAFRRITIDAGRRIIQRAIDRGELRPGTSSAFVFDALSGSVEHRLAYIPDDRRAEFDRRSEEYLENLVDFILAAATSAHAQAHVAHG